MPIINNIAIRAEFYSGLQQVTDEMMATATATATSGDVSVVETTVSPEITNSLTTASSIVTNLLTDTDSETIQVITSTSASSLSSTSTVTHVQHEVQTSSNGAGVAMCGNKKKRTLMLGLLSSSLLFSLL